MPELILTHQLYRANFSLAFERDYVRHMFAFGKKLGSVAATYVQKDYNFIANFRTSLYNTIST